MCRHDRADATLAILFPGQGVGDPSSGELVRSVRPDLHRLAVELTGDDPFERIAEATRFAQPAIYCASIAGFERRGRPEALAYAGHSLGEIGALVAAGAIGDLDGLRIAAERGRLMDEAAVTAVDGGMLAVGGDREQALVLAERHGLALANDNSPEQIVLSGRDAGLEARGPNRASSACERSGSRSPAPSTRPTWRRPPSRSQALLSAIEFAPTACRCDLVRDRLARSPTTRATSWSRR